MTFGYATVCSPTRGFLPAGDRARHSPQSSSPLESHLLVRGPNQAIRATTPTTTTTQTATTSNVLIRSRLPAVGSGQPLPPGVGDGH